MTDSNLWCNSMRYSAGRAFEVQRAPRRMTQVGTDTKCHDPLTEVRRRALVMRFGVTEPQASALCTMIWGAQ